MSQSPVYRQNLFLRLFPTPTFLSMPTVGIDLSYQSVRLAQLIPAKRGFTLGDFDERRIPEGSAYADDLTSSQELKNILRTLKEDYDLSFVSVALPEDKAYLFTLTLPAMSEEELEQAIGFQLEENVPISLNDAIFDFEIISPADHSGHVEVAVTVFPKKLIESSLQLFKEVGMKPVTFHLNASVITRALIPEGDKRTYLITNLGEKSTGIYIVSNGFVQFASTLAFGGESLTQAIQKHLSVSREEALKIRRGEIKMKNHEAIQLFYSLANAVSALRDEINRIAVYWQTHHGKTDNTNRGIDKILLCGSGAHLPGFDEYVSTSMKVEVEVGNVWQNVCRFEDIIPVIPFADSLNYAAAIGASLVSQTHSRTL